MVLGWALLRAVRCSSLPDHSNHRPESWGETEETQSPDVRPKDAAAVTDGPSVGEAGFPSRERGEL